MVFCCNLPYVTCATAFPTPFPNMVFSHPCFLRAQNFMCYNLLLSVPRLLGVAFFFFSFFFCICWDDHTILFFYLVLAWQIIDWSWSCFVILELQGYASLAHDVLVFKVFHIKLSLKIFISMLVILTWIFFVRFLKHLSSGNRIILCLTNDRTSTISMPSYFLKKTLNVFVYMVCMCRHACIYVFMCVSIWVWV